MRSRSAGSMLPRVFGGALRLVTRDGAVEREWPLLLSSHPHQFSRWSGGIWIHAERQHLCFGDSAEPLAVYGRGYEGMPGQLRVFGTQMLVFETTVLQQGLGRISEHATWVDLDTKLPDQRFTWDRQVGATVVRRRRRADRHRRGRHAARTGRTATLPGSNTRSSMASWSTAMQSGSSTATTSFAPIGLDASSRAPRSRTGHTPCGAFRMV